MSEIALPRGEYVARVVSIGARSTPGTIDTPVTTIELVVSAGLYRGRTFSIEFDLAMPAGLEKLREVARATGLDTGSETVLDTIRGPVARAAARMAAQDLVEAVTDAIRGRSARFTVWRFSDDPEPVATAWRALPVDQPLFNAAIERTPRLAPSDFSRIIGHHLGKIIASDVEEGHGSATLAMDVVLFKNRRRLDVVELKFEVVHPDAHREYRGRCLVQRIASAVGVYAFNDVEDLHDTVFSFTVFNDREFHFVCRPATEGEKDAFEVASGNRWLWPTRKDFEKYGDGGGPHAA